MGIDFPFSDDLGLVLLSAGLKNILEGIVWMVLPNSVLVGYLQLVFWLAYRSKAIQRDHQMSSTIDAVHSLCLAPGKMLGNLSS